MTNEVNVFRFYLIFDNYMMAKLSKNDKNGMFHTKVVISNNPWQKGQNGGLNGVLKSLCLSPLIVTRACVVWSNVSVYMKCVRETNSLFIHVYEIVSQMRMCEIKAISSILLTKHIYKLLPFILKHLNAGHSLRVDWVFFK